MSQKPKDALETALRFLSHSAHTEAEVRKKLIQREFPESKIEEAISQLHSLKYLDDDAILLAEVKRHGADNKHGTEYLKKRLIKRGFNDNQVQIGLSRIDHAKEVAKAKELANKKWQAQDNAAKIGRHLFGLGFTSEIVESVVEFFSDLRD